MEASHGAGPEISGQETEAVREDQGSHRDAHSARTGRALLGFLLVAGLFFYAFRLARVVGRSMEPTFRDGQWLLVRRLNWPSPPLRPGDVVVFRMRGELLVKRVVAVAGERVPDVGPMLLLRPSRDYPGRWEGVVIATPPRAVPEGHVYVLGDNRAVSIDSRSFGLVPVSALMGRVLRWNDPGRVPPGGRGRSE
jgi:signal peptidase I